MWHRIAVVLCLATVPLAAHPTDAVLLRSGTPILLELQHHITSAYTAPGSTVRFRVAESVTVDGRVLLAAGSPVAGRMRATTDRAALGTSGTMTFVVDFVQAVDGQEIRVVASESRQGRDRGNALAGWSIFWGLPGLMTRGVHSWLARGTRFEALVLHDRRIGETVPVATPLPNWPDVTLVGRVLKHRSSASQTGRLRIDFERDRPLGTLEFVVEPPAESSVDLSALRLVAVDGEAIDEPVLALSATSDVVQFDGWSLLRYCRNGRTMLRWLGLGADGQPVGFEYGLDVEIRSGE